MIRLTTLRLPDATHKTIKEHAKRKEMTVLGFIRLILNNWAKRHGSKTST
jgi:hypothetical protein